jgi:hypothetical protein
MKKICIFLAFWAFNATGLHAQYFNNMPLSQRDSMLIAKATETVMKYAKEYYRDYGKPKIEYEVMNVTSGTWVNDNGRGYYNVKFPYDTLKESFWDADYSVLVAIWSDSGEPASIEAGGWRNRLDKPESKNLSQIPLSVYPPYWKFREAALRQRQAHEDSLINAGLVTREQFQKFKQTADSLNRVQKKQNY